MLFIESILIQLFLSVLPYEIQMLMNVFLILLVYVVNWRVFLKAGEKGWKSLIPFYNEYGIYSEDLNNTLFHFKNNVLDTYIF